MSGGGYHWSGYDYIKHSLLFVGPVDDYKSCVRGILMEPLIYRVIIGSKQLVTGEDSVLGTSVILQNQNEVSCGHFEPLTEKIIVVAKFDKLLRGFMKMTQFGTSNWATGMPTEIYYFLDVADRNTSYNRTDLVEIEWEFIEEEKDICSNAPIFDPFRMNVSVIN
ncbi:hypothetical protein KIN20_022833 [Parelaphostrongylus tenuis]|uniref:Uncharacterized protein n=1 Tax=Parelaphostrongylus tenuis TaxID=148309 RepID=A0AAD5QVJ2_PARTN|nr:hypothetical protein KIN20_022833 [Parelaphostrongylus tenuis]